MTNQEISAVIALINEAKESAIMQRDLITDDLASYGFNPSALEEVVKEKGLTVDNMTDNLPSMIEVEELVCQVRGTDEDAMEDYNRAIESFKEENTTDEEAVRKWLSYGIKSINDMIASETDLKNLEDEANGEIKSYTDYICSEAYDNHRKSNIEMWKSMLEREENPVKARALRKTIYIAENRYTLAFMFERLHDEKTAEKEHKAIIENFFSNNRSDYIMKKFADKCRQFDITPDGYRYLLDIEERFLEEKYHVYNNFFLFTAMRFISHCTESEINEVKEIMQCMLNLVYQRFYSDEVKEIFLNTVRSFLDEFEEDRERFDKDNILHPNHPYRIAKKKEKDAATRAKIYQLLEDENYMTDELKDELEKMEMDELFAFFKEKMDEKDAKESEDDTDEDATETDDEDTEDENEESEEDASIEDDVEVSKEADNEKVEKDTKELDTEINEESNNDAKVDEESSTESDEK